MDDRTASRLDRIRVATLATISADGRPHLVPVVFARDGEEIVTAIDGKPKKQKTPARIANISRDPRVTLLAHLYDEDWSKLWWVRVDGTASLEDDGEAFSRASTALRKRYPQYETVDLTGPVIRIAVARAISWDANAQ